MEPRTPDSVEPWPSNWPVIPYVGVLAFAFASTTVLIQALDGAEMNFARTKGQLAIAVVLALRLVWARCRRERNRIWIAYVIAMFLAAPIWLLVEPLILSLGR